MAVPGSKRGKGSLGVMLGDILPLVLRKNGLQREFGKWQVFTLWDGVVGRSIALQTYPTRFSRGTLSVTIANSAWLQELQFMKAEIIGRLNREIEQAQASWMSGPEDQLDLDFPRVKELRFTVGKVSRRAKDIKTRAPEVLRRATPEEEAEAIAETAGVADPELRELLRETFLQAKRRGGRKRT